MTINEKTVLIGAGSAMFTRGLVADMIRGGWEGELHLVDIDPAALEIAEKLCRKMLKAASSPIKLHSATDRRRALKDATLVVTTIAVGGRRAWEKDVFIPRKYGIFQPVGDTCMPGGASRALRMIPAMADIARDVMKLAPKALFFNYANPMSAVCRGVRKATGAEVIGLCHGVRMVVDYLSRLLEVERGALGYTAVGINHLTWFYDIRVNGQDVMERLAGIAREKLSPPDGVYEWSPGPFTWQMLLTFGAFPAVFDRHVIEFFPHMFSREKSYFGHTAGVDDRFMGSGKDRTGFEYVIERGDRIFEEMRRVALSPEPLAEDFLAGSTGEEEELTAIVEDIRNDRPGVWSANLPNRGQAANLPMESVLECPVIAGTTGLRPIMLPPIDSGIAGTLADRFQWVETTVEAALTGSRRKFIQALLIDGAVTSVETAEKLADELLGAHAEHLPQFK